MSQERKILVGSRKSELALIQTKHVISLLKGYHPEKEFEIVTMNTLGDQILDVPLPKIGEKSLFTKELETALHTSRVDFVVHSLKDLPTALPKGMAIGAVLAREDPRDALVLQKDLEFYTLATLPQNSIIGTSSLRRTAQLCKKYPHLKVENIRGNLNTRLKKLDDLGKYQAIILAAAGLIRIGWSDRITKILDEDELLYAAGQGALAVECREDNLEILKLLEPLYDLHTALRVTAERSFLKTLGGGCSAPVAVSSTLKKIKSTQFELMLSGAVWSLDGKDEIGDKMKDDLNLSKDLRCADCPYRKGNPVRDIESLECDGCSFASGDEPNLKRTKLDVPIDILKNDPHDKCPIKIPIGADFMGKCPYLENKVSSTSVEEFNTCPFLNSQNFYSLNDVIETSEESCKDEVSLFCGLVLHKGAAEDAMQKALKLGEKLANVLISKGALDVMAKAQAIVHNSLPQKFDTTTS